LHSIQKKSTFAPALVRNNFFNCPIKRESGENPEQTRYCKSYATFRQFIATVPPARDGKAARNGDKSGDLPAQNSLKAFEE
jgi:hypothetical protein